MSTRSFSQHATRDMIASIVAMGWPRDQVEPLVVEHLGQMESVLICFNEAAARDWIVRHRLCGEG